MDTPSALNNHEIIHLRLSQLVATEAMERAILNLVVNHIALRTTFSKAGNEWHQCVGLAPSKAFQLTVHEKDSHKYQIASVAEQSKARLSLMNGPLLTVDYIPSAQRLVLVASKLTLDSNSWSIVLEDLDNLLQGSTTTRPATTIEELPWLASSQLSSGKTNNQSSRGETTAKETMEEASCLEYWGLTPAHTYLSHDMSYKLR